jgi:hypothetical protein
MAKITGRVEVVVNGKTLLNKPGASASGIGASGKPPVERKEVIGDTGLHGFTETPVAAKCEVPITDRDDIMLGDFDAIQGDGTIIFRAAGGGKVYTLKDATCTGNFSVKGGEGETTLTFIGSSWTESTSES